MKLEEIPEHLKPWYTSDQIAASRSPAVRRVIEDRLNFLKQALDRYLSQSAGKSFNILDAGCGDGVFTRFFSSYAQGTIYAVDYNPLRLDRLKSLAADNPNVMIEQVDLKKLNFPTDSFHFIWCNQVIEHISADEAAFLELRRVLTKNGILIIGTPNEGCFLGQLRNTKLQPIILKNTDHVNFYTLKTLRAKIERCGLTIQQIWREGFMSPHTSIHNRLSSHPRGYTLLKILGRMFPSQAGGLFLVCTKDI